MQNKAMLGWPILLFAASCVPQAAADQIGAAVVRPAAAVRASASPGIEALGLTLATEEPPPLEILAREIAPGAAARPFDVSEASDRDVRSAIDCLTAAVYYEARSESEGGQRAVAQVVLNRVRHPAFPKTVCGVVYQGSNRTTGCQFSFTCDGSLRRGREPGAWDRARRVADDALAGYVYAPVGVATHYHTTAIRPWWAASLARAVTIGSHIFYRWRGEWGDPKSFRRPYVGAEAFARAAGTAARPAETKFGVQVHRAADEETPEEAPAFIEVAGVRIHRSGRRETGVAAEDSGGVRIHRGAPTPAEEAPSYAAADAPSDASAPAR
ncbi:MAG TPA: cell wall hydrolase [Allosphingosinicella sp.]|nr:cell wall hydrolase [Allosphingosinicella sp.]